MECLVGDLGPSLLHRLTSGTGDIEDVDLNAEYSDDDRDIYFSEKQLIEYLRHQEEDNLFKISMLQDDEQTYENLEKASQKKLAEKQQEVDKQSESIEALKSKVEELKKKSAFYNANYDSKRVKIASPPSTAAELPKNGTDPLTSWMRVNEIAAADEEMVVGGLKNLIFAQDQKSVLDLSDLVEQLKKFELTMNDLFEERRILKGSLQYADKVKMEEKIAFDFRKEKNMKESKQAQIKKKQDDEKTREKKNQEREGNIQKSGKRVKHRSERIRHKTNTKVKVEIDPEEADMQRYLEFSLLQGEFMPPPKE